MCVLLSVCLSVHLLCEQELEGLAYQEDTKEDLEGQVAQLEGKLSLAEETVKGVFLLLCQVGSCLSATCTACVTMHYKSDIVAARATVYMPRTMVMVVRLPTLLLLRGSSLTSLQFYY